MNEEELKHRTKQFGLRVIKLVESLPAMITARTIGNQLIRSGLSVGANYRAACRGKSKADFIAKAGIVLEEGDESLY
jgi:four helix bundle protein